MAPPDLLALFNFTDGNDVAINVKEFFTWRVGFAKVGNNDLYSVNTGLGDDIIIGYTNPDFPSPFAPDRENGFKNRGIITNPGGSLTIEGYAYPSNVRISPPEPSYGFVNETLVYDDENTLSGVITSKEANDRLYGYAESYPGQLGWGMYLGSQPNFSQGQVIGRSLVDLGGGHDEIIGEAYTTNSRSHGIHVNWAPSKVLLGDGNDIFNGYAESEGNSWAVGIKIDNGAVVDLGLGDDLLEGTAVSTGDRAWGIQIARGGVLQAGDGNDTITGTSKGGSQFSTGILNQDNSVISLGGGDDKLQGISNVGSAIWNTKGAVIDAGTGNDTIDALNGGFRGSGTYRLGPGNDTVIGHGEGYFYGGTGVDTLVFGKGTYTFDNVTGRILAGRTIMNVSEFEQIRGVNGGLFKLQPGQFQVDSNGIGFSSSMDPVVDPVDLVSSPDADPIVDEGEAVSSPEIDPIVGFPESTNDFLFYVYDTLTNSEVSSFENGDTITGLIPVARRTIVVDFIGDDVASDEEGSMRMSLTNSVGTLISNRVENIAPYVTFGDIRGNLMPGPGLANGESYVLNVTMFSEDNAAGTILGSEAIEFSFT